MTELDTYTIHTTPNVELKKARLGDFRISPQTMKETCPNTTDKKHIWNYKWAFGITPSLVPDKERLTDSLGNTKVPEIRKCFACGMIDPLKAGWEKK